MRDLIKKYNERLAVLKHNRAVDLDVITDNENYMYDKEIEQVAEFIQDLKQLTLNGVVQVEPEVCECSHEQVSPLGYQILCRLCGNPKLKVN